MIHMGGMEMKDLLIYGGAGIGARVVFNQQTPMSAFLADGDYPWRRQWHRPGRGGDLRGAGCQIGRASCRERVSSPV